MARITTEYKVMSQVLATFYKVSHAKRVEINRKKAPQKVAEFIVLSIDNFSWIRKRSIYLC